MTRTTTSGRAMTYTEVKTERVCEGVYVTKLEALMPCGHQYRANVTIQYTNEVAGYKGWLLVIADECDESPYATKRAAVEALQNFVNALRSGEFVPFSEPSFEPLHGKGICENVPCGA